MGFSNRAQRFTGSNYLNVDSPFLTTLITVTAVPTFSVLSQYFWKEQFDTFDNRCDVLRAAFCDSCDVFVERLHDLFLAERLHDSYCWEFAWFCVWRGCVIFVLLFVEVTWFFCGEVAWFFCAELACFCCEEVGWFFLDGKVAWFLEKRLCDFVHEEVASFLCVERLHDFAHSLTQSGCMIYFFWRLRDFILQRGCVIFVVEILYDFLCEEVAWFSMWRGCVIFVWECFWV